MKPLCLAAVVALLASPAHGQTGLSLSFDDGRVSIAATDQPLRRILTEWARLGGTRIVGLEKLGGTLVTIELDGVPERDALEILLRSVAGYIVAPHAGAVTASRSHVDRLVLLPTSVASAAPPPPPRPTFAPPPVPRAPQTVPDPIQLANPDTDGPAGQPGPLFVQPEEPATGPAGPPMPVMPGAPGEPPQQPEAEPVAPTPLIVNRPGVIPLPRQQTTPPRP